MNKKHKKSPENIKGLITKKQQIVIVSILAAIVSLIFLTRAGAIPNYLGLDFLCTGETVKNLPPEHMRLDKPVIYLYPLSDQFTQVKLSIDGKLSFTYPNYENGWSVIAHPDGKITDLKNGGEYSYLFWEGIMKPNYDMTTGFVVRGSDTLKFLQTTLVNLGLAPSEYNDFIVYWVPKMQDNKYNLIHFATKVEYDDRVVLNVTPKPDSILRVFMVTKKLEKEINVASQKISPFERRGFTVVEWGGTSL